jgi:cytosine/adenosine deaminase-related metal-dependent hydrolase
MSIVLHAGTIITGNSQGEILKHHSVVIEGNRIISLVPTSSLQISKQDTIFDATNHVLIPGFIQTHIHLCQTLFRGLADDLELLDWLQQKIFPFEAAHNKRSMYASAMLGIAELIRGGTTTILDMGSVNHEEEVIKAIGETGLRAFVGKAMMDVNDAYPKLKESTEQSFKTTRALAERWHNSYDGRVKYAAAPRFVLSCTDKLLTQTQELVSSSNGMLLHTHASENKGEVEAVRHRTKMENIEFLHSIGLLSARACLAHCIHLSDHEINLLRDTKTSIAHCPSSNLKLGSGIATIPMLQKSGINVSLGADGAPCNNNLNIFQEMRLASLIQKPLYGPTVMPAETVFRMATIDGARALGLQHEIGSIEIGKKADIVLLNLEHIWNPLASDNDSYSTIVYSAGPENVDSVMIDGRWIFRKKEFVSLDTAKVLAEGRKELKLLLDRVEMS